MYVISNPIEVTDSIFAYSSIVEPDISLGEAMWSGITSYTIGVEVVSPNNHRIYKNIQAGISAIPPELEPTRWTESDRVSNKWSAVDLARNTKSSSPNDIVMIFTLPSAIDSIGLTGLVGESIEIRLNNGASDIYTYSQLLFYRQATNFYEWHFGKFRQIPNIVRLDIPPVSGCTLTITVKKLDTVAKIAGVVPGTKEYLGSLQRSSSNKGLNFTRIQRDNVVAKLVPRYSRPLITAELIISSSRLQALQQVRSDLNDKVTVWSGLDDDNIQLYHDLYLVNGLWQQFYFNYLSPNESTLNLEIEEL